MTSIGAFTPAQLGSVGTSFFNHELTINNGIDEQEPSAQWGSPALNSLVTRCTNFFRDNGDNTLTEDNPRATTPIWHRDNITISVASGSPTPQDAKE